MSETTSAATWAAAAAGVKLAGGKRRTVYVFPEAPIAAQVRVDHVQLIFTGETPGYTSLNIGWYAIPKDTREKLEAKIAELDAAGLLVETASGRSGAGKYAPLAIGYVGGPVQHIELFLGQGEGQVALPEVWIEVDPTLAPLTVAPVYQASDSDDDSSDDDSSDDDDDSDEGDGDQD